MSRRTILYTDWLREVIRNPGDYAGHPIAEVCAKLGVSKQRVHQLLDDDSLEALSVTTRAGDVALTLVTPASLDYYLTHRRRYADDGRFTLDPA